MSLVVSLHISAVYLHYHPLFIYILGFLSAVCLHFSVVFRLCQLFIYNFRIFFSCLFTFLSAVRLHISVVFRLCVLFIYILVVLSAVYLHFTYKVFCQLFIYIFKFSSAVCLYIPVVYLQFFSSLFTFYNNYRFWRENSN